MSDDIRALRLAKNISQVKLAEATGLSEGQVIRIEQGGGKTTAEEITTLVKAIKSMPANDRKISGRPFADASKNAATAALRGEVKAKPAPIKKAVATKPAPPAVKKVPASRASSVAKALAKKAPARAK